MSTPLDSIVAAAKDVIGGGTMNMNVELQLREKFSKGGSVDEILGHLKTMLGTRKLNKTAETQIRNGANTYLTGKSPKLKAHNLVVEHDSIMQNTPKKGVNASQKKAFEEAGPEDATHGGNLNPGATAGAQSRVGAATNSGNTNAANPSSTV